MKTSKKVEYMGQPHLLLSTPPPPDQDGRSRMWCALYWMHQMKGAKALDLAPERAKIYTHGSPQSVVGTLQ
eukprot:superscaffoldBa00000183_g2480